MSRLPRFQFPGALYHVTARANAGAALFRDDSDRAAFMAVLGRVVERHGWECHLHCLLGTHYHLLVQTPDGDLAAGMHRLNWFYARSFNGRHGTIGHVFQDRYDSVLVQTEPHLRELVRYISLNPVRAGICAEPADWPWSSYAALVGLEPVPSLPVSSWLLAQFGHDPSRARERVREFVEAPLLVEAAGVR